MKTAFATGIVLLFCAGHVPALQSQTAASKEMQGAQPAANLPAVLVQIQQVTNATNIDIGKLRVEKWKTDPEQKQQLQHIADSLQKSMVNAIPVLITDVESSRGGVTASFKLYHNLNVIYENLNYLADVAGGLGKKEEFDPLAADCAALGSARQNLSIYIEQTAVKLESANRQSNGTIPIAVGQSPNGPQKKIIVINEDDPPQKAAKPAKKKASTSTAANPSQSTAAPH